MQCPICGGEEFGDYRSRKNVRCKSCGSFERSRLLWLTLKAIDLDAIEKSFYHFAPEIGIAQKLSTKLKDKYRPFDFDPEIYAKGGIDVESFDLCTDLNAIESNSVQAVCHVHVLEHVRCNVGKVMEGLNRILAPGGYHILGIPYFSKRYKEDFDPELTEAHRLEHFGQEDHVRSFGTEDFDLMFADSFKGMTELPLKDLVSPDAFAEANVPSRAYRNNSSHAVRVWRKL